MAVSAYLEEQIAWEDALLLTFCQFYAFGILHISGKSF